MTAFNPSDIDWKKINDLLPVIIQDNQTGQVLMLGYMNQEALDSTCETGQVTFYSRTKKRLWMKGETSGHILQVVQILTDCDNDALLILAEIKGPCCHLNQPSCFGAYSAVFSALVELEKVILSRYQERPDQHYTTQLFDQGLKRIAQKVGEEGVEVALAASCGDKKETINETADLLYHLLVLLIAKQISLKEVNSLLKQRQML
ncbi:bifunctional phosphoribosyl-AMP cyclohydrolase/phosphoribosyl-ATP diphosphatase HisIE [Legionella fairfieldensis]|uniref:bifunctional phosphoribosyl-AMP cyclohydrolase/phosphoribosyl-ATP diphosphatase HisIE n=1 Tax=Legionella fairfieldensis TaxID=45064 RepID=UPI0005682D4E|nr:bifunctional phosphoribosyl-AMP cyclohydrolase/phosphoribosyl-ATP diphosphatase HisIE [Legionella fairfieldensis]